MESSSPMSFKLPVRVIDKYKDKLEKKSSFKKSLTEEIRKMCNFVDQIKDHSFITIQISQLEKETNVNKRYVVTEVDSKSSKLLKDFRNKYDVTQSALLWLWIENNGKITLTKSNKVKKEKQKSTETETEIKTEPISEIKTENKQKNINKKNEHNNENNMKCVKTNILNTSKSNMSKIEKLMTITEYDGPTEPLTIVLPPSILEKFESNLPEAISLEKAMQNEIRKLCKVARVSKTRTTIVNHVKRIEKYKVDKTEILIKIDPESMTVLNLFNNSYGISKSGLIWLWLSSDTLKYNIFKLVD